MFGLILVEAEAEDAFLGVVFEQERCFSVRSVSIGCSVSIWAVLVRSGLKCSALTGAGSRSSALVEL